MHQKLVSGVAGLWAETLAQCTSNTCGVSRHFNVLADETELMTSIFRIISNAEHTSQALVSDTAGND